MPMFRTTGFLRLAARKKRPRASVARLYSASPPYGSNEPAFAGFMLDPEFVESHRRSKAGFGFNGLGEVVYQRTYSRLRNDLWLDSGSPVPGSSMSSGTSCGRSPGSSDPSTAVLQQEQWFQTVERVVNGTYAMQKRWIESQGLGWDAEFAQTSAQKMFSLMFTMKFLPPGRGLWAMGTPITEERKLYAALNNCAFVSTAASAETDFDPVAPYVFLMDASMLGVGVGFDTLAAGNTKVSTPPSHFKHAPPFVVPDSREGWVESLRRLLNAYLHHHENEEPGSHSAEGNSFEAATSFDYSEIRPAGVPIAGFGGTSAGPSALMQLHHDVRGVLDRLIDAGEDNLSVTAVVDIMNMIGRCVVSGNVRRTAEIAFGDPNCSEYIDLKNYEKNPDRMEFGWTSNNSIYAQLGMDYGPACERVRMNGEPGFAWLDNMRNYGRMNGQIDTRDHRVSGGNPCLEQSLESFEMCCLVETFPHAHDSLEDYLETLRYAYLYAKTVTLGSTHWPQTNKVMLRNRRIGCSMSGVAQFTASRGLDSLREWCEAGYDEIQRTDERLSEWLSIPRSVKTTSIKPSGTVSLLAGATPGVHFPEARYYIRRVRMPRDNNWMVERLQVAGYPVEPAEGDEDRTVVVSFPVDVGKGVRTLGVQREEHAISESEVTAKGVSMWEQLSMAAFLQRHWADNQVSCTVTFDPISEGPQLKHALDIFQYQLKGISFLPKIETGAFAQMPYEEIDEMEYNRMKESLQEVNLEPPLVEIPLSFHKEHDHHQQVEAASATSAEEVTLKKQKGNSFMAPSSVPDSYCDNDSCSI